MTSYEFEVAAKNAVIDIFNDLRIEDIQLVWFTHTLGNKKCCLYAPGMGTSYAEVTYSKEQDVMWVDIYDKIIHSELTSDKFKIRPEVR